MNIIRTVKKMKQTVRKLIHNRQEIGFVPTMGYLHEGHLALIEKARQENDIVIVSIFVNPLQFAPNEDYEQYPRDEERDKKRAEAAGVDILFIPDAKDIYPSQMKIDIKVKDRIDVLCGRSRPGHFDGVVTILFKLFNIVLPDKTYFGMKDAQQLAVVEAFITDLNFPIELIGVQTVREKNGLAKSSRNVYLSEHEREEAAWIYKGLQNGQQLIIDGERNPIKIIKKVEDVIRNKTNGSIDYVELLSFPSLKPVKSLNSQVILACAVYFNDARLIDNIIMDQDGNIKDSIHLNVFNYK